MVFNYQKEKLRFDREQEELRRKYIAAGMSEECIREMYEYDWDTFKRDRVYSVHNCSFDFDADYEDDDFVSATGGAYAQFLERLGSTDQYLTDNFSDLLQSIDDIALLKALRTMTARQTKILEMLVCEQKSQVEIAKELGINRSVIIKQMRWIRKKLKKFAD